MNKDEEMNREAEEFSAEESEEKIPEKNFFKGENFSEIGEERRSTKKKTTTVDMMNILQKRARSKEPSNLLAHRAEFIKARTLGMSLSPVSFNTVDLRKRVKSMTDFTMRILEKYREIDKIEYSKFLKSKVKDKKVDRVKHNFYLLSKNFAQKSMVFMLNSYDETGICRLFQEFYLEFDQNKDRKMQIDELEKCIELLSKDNYMGKEKMIQTLMELGIDCTSSFSLFQEGNANKILNDETLNKLYKKFQVTQNTRKIDLNLDHVDFNKFAPIISIFFFEYISILFLQKRENFTLYLGFPHTITITGKAQFDLSKDPEGIYRVFIAQLRGSNSITKPLITYKDVTQSLITFRSIGYSDSLSMEALERIMKEIKEFMGVDPISGQEERKFSMKELLPTLVCMIEREIRWKREEYRKSIEKYDQKVKCYGCGLAVKLNRKNLAKLLVDAFCNLPFPNYEQFIKGLDFILKKMIPTLVSPAAIYIANKLMRTPDTIVTEQGFNGEVKVRFNIKYIATYDDLFERLYYFTMKFQVKLMYVRLLFKGSYSTYKTTKRINQTILKYNMIMKSNDLFEAGNPGKFGNFEDAALKLLKNEDPEELLKVENERKELKKKRFLENLMNFEKKTEDKQKKKNSEVVRHSIIKLAQSEDKSKKVEPVNDLKMTLDILQAEANKIDTNINRKEIEKLKELSKVRISSAFPNTEDVTPEIVMNLIKNSKNQSKEVKRLKEFIYHQSEAINFQDIQKFLVAEHLKKKNREEEANTIMNSQTRYKIKDLFEEQEKYKFKQMIKFELKRSKALNGIKDEETKEEEPPVTTENEELVTKKETETENVEKGEKDENWKDMFDFTNFEEDYFQDYLKRNKAETVEFNSKHKKSKDEDKDRGCECSIF